MPDAESMMLEMLKDSIDRLADKVDTMDTRMREEIAINHHRHQKVTNNHTAMRGDIRMVSAKVAAMVSAGAFGITLMLKKMGIY